MKLRHAAPDRASLEAIINAAPRKPLTPHMDTVDSRPMLSVAPAAGAVVKTTTRAEFGLTEWTLSNGIRVLLKPTTLKEDEIVFRATSPGGSSRVSDADYQVIRSGVSIISAGGLGRFSAADLRKELTGKIASVTPVIDELDQGLVGSSSKRDLEVMLQLIYMRFMEPRHDPAVLASAATRNEGAPRQSGLRV